MNYKLLAIGYCVLSIGFFSYSSSGSSSGAPDSRAVVVASESRRNLMSGMEMAHAMFEQNFGTLRDLQEEHRVLSLRHAEATTSLRLREEALEGAKTELRTERVALMSKLEALHLRLQTREQELSQLALQLAARHNDEKIAMQQQAADEKLKMQNDNADEKLKMQARFTRYIAITAIASAACTWGFCKITSSMQSITNIFGTVTKRILGSQN